MSPDTSIDETTLRAVEAGARLARHLERTLAQADLTLPQFRLLLHLERGTDVASELARKAQIKPPSLTALVDGLASRSLVQRTPDVNDRRRVHLAITPAGVTALAEGRRVAAKRLVELAKGRDSSPNPEIVETLAGWVDLLDAWRDAHLQ
ncbi:MAG: MarR family transcriptional regulator [Actinomycetia bacterium]|nr:MarR family transcriptional regulator [Actinomycetes bacterium]